MSESFVTSIVEQVLEAVASGKHHIVYWGVSPDGLQIIGRLMALGVGAYTSAIVSSQEDLVGTTIFAHEVLPPRSVSDVPIDLLVITADTEKEAALREFSEVDERIPQVVLAGTNHFEFVDAEFERIAASCLVKSYANGYPNSLIHIYQSIKYLADKGLSGDVAEFGIFKGGTIVFIAKTLAHFGFDDVKVYGFDIFEGFPSRRSVFDLYSNPKCEFKDFESVQRYCVQYGIEVIKGDICETHHILNRRQLMLSFFDTDNYTPVSAALQTCYDQTIEGGILAFDHYTSEERFVYTIGERMAAEEILADKKVFHLHGTGIFMKC